MKSLASVKGGTFKALGTLYRLHKIFGRNNGFRHPQFNNASPRSILPTKFNPRPPIRNSIIYSSDLPVAFSTNLFKMLVLLVISSSFSGAKPPFLISLSKRANSLAANPSFLANLSKTLT